MLRFLPQTPFASAPERDATDVLRVAGAAGESVVMFFAIDAGAAVADVSIAAGPGIDLHLVLAREQPGTSLERTAMRSVRELLVKDDRIRLDDGFAFWCGHVRHIPRRALRPRRVFYLPPDLRIDGEVRTSFDAGERKQLHARVLLPSRSTRRAIEVRDARGALLESIDIEIEVVPIELVEPHQERFLWFRGTLDCFDPRHFVPDERFAEQLRAIRSAGFTSISLAERRAELLDRALQYAVAAGFRGDVVLLAPLPDRIDRVDFRGLRPIVYAADEPDVDPAHRLAGLRRNLDIARALGFRTMVSLLDGRYQTSREIADVDLVDVWFPRNRTNRSRRYYWQCHLETPNAHRLLAGAGLWAGGAPGIAPYCFQHRSIPGSSPFDDNALWDPAHSDMRPHMATYPSRYGTIPTLQWSALQTGLSDLRWLVTIEQRTKGRDDAQRALQTIRAAALTALGEALLRPDDVAWEDAAAHAAETMRRDLLGFARTLTRPGSAFAPEDDLPR